MMRLQIEKIKEYLTGRFVINAYFWVGFLLIPILTSLGEHQHDKPNIRALAIFTFYYAVIVYFNNLFLIPQLLQRKKYLIYFGVLVTLIGIWAYLQVKHHTLFYGCNCLIHISSENVTMAGFQIATFVIGFSAFKLVKDYKKQEEVYKESEREAEKIQLLNEINFLKAQINPHFLFNTLNSLYAFALEESPKVPDFILKVSEIMRYMMHECNEAFVPLEKEINYLNSYVELQKIRMENRGTVTFIVEGDPVGNVIAPSLLINFIENCFKHSLDSMISDIWIYIKIEINEGGSFSFTTKNTKQTQDEYQKLSSKESSGIGLENVKKRLHLIYPNKHTLAIVVTDKTYQSTLTLQLK